VMIRVALISHTGEQGGAELSMVDLADELRRLDVAPLLVFLEDGPVVDVARRRGIPAAVVALSAKTVRVRRHQAFASSATASVDVIGCAVRLASLVKKADMQLIHTNSLKAHVIGGVAGRFARTPVLWHLRDIVSPPHVSRTEAAFMRAAAHLATAVIANSKATASAFGRTDGVYEPGVDLAHFADVPPLTPVRPERLEILALGRLAKWKGQDVLLRAVRLLAPVARPRIVFAGAPLFGEEAYAASLRASARGISCEWRGHISSVRDALASCHVMAHNSVYPEPFGKVVVEALAAGRPALATRCGGPEEILPPEVHSDWLVEPGDPYDLASAILRIHDDWETTVVRAAAARGAAARFDVTAAAHRMCDLYERLATARDGAGPVLRARRGLRPRQARGPRGANVGA
jgi:glycosyltransferase involved in cell wall biosynthesis